MKHLKTILDFATENHKGQKRKDGKDYITHPIAVAQIAAEIAQREGKSTKFIEMVTVISWLHDGPEDVGMEAKDIREILEFSKNFSKEEVSLIIRAIIYLTRLTKESSIIEYLDFIKSDSLSRIVKLADLEHNLSDLGPGNLRDKYHLCQYYLNN